MTTALTPRLQRAIDYATQEIFTVLPESIEALMVDITRMRSQDVSERAIIQALFSAVDVSLELESLEKAVAEILDSLPQGPVH